MARAKTEDIEKRFKKHLDQQVDEGLFEDSQPQAKQVKGRRLREARFIPMDQIIPDPAQPRQKFPPGSIKELADSIKERGVLQPISVSFDGGLAKYVIVWGERRFRAAKVAGLTEIPCLTREGLDESTRLAEQLIENLQREDLNPVEKADGLLKLKESLGQNTSWKEVETLTGFSKRRRNQIIAIKKLPEEIQKEIVSLGTKRLKNQITEGHARALLRLPSKSLQLKLVNLIKTSQEPISSQKAMQLVKEWLGEKKEPDKFKRLIIKYTSTEDLVAKLKEKLKELQPRKTKIGGPSKAEQEAVTEVEQAFDGTVRFRKQH